MGTTSASKLTFSNLSDFSTKQAMKVGAYILVVGAVVLAPVAASAAANSANTTINATVQPVISISTPGTVALSLTPTPGGVVSSASDTVTVNTNNATGYVLTMADNDAATSLQSGANSIVAHAGTKTAPTALGNNTWGYALNTGTTGIGTNGFDAAYTAETNNVASTSKWAGVPASGAPVTLKTTAATASNDTTTVWYGVKANASQPNGVYTDVVTYTATTN